ncbi:MAG: hypothetical protein ABUJ93_02180, partial [Hyphomicrobium sp.]
YEPDELPGCSTPRHQLIPNERPNENERAVTSGMRESASATWAILADRKSRPFLSSGFRFCGL